MTPTACRRSAHGGEPGAHDWDLHALVAAEVAAVVGVAVAGDRDQIAAPEHRSIFSALRAGARGYLLKGADQEQIRAAVQAAANGEIIFGTQLAARMLAYFTTPASAPPPVFPQLTDREREVLDLVAQGRANMAIATRLGLSQKTVRNHVSNILTKLQVADRAQAIVQARDAGLGHQSRV